jgi:hypothetical protein
VDGGISMQTSGWLSPDPPPETGPNLATEMREQAELPCPVFRRLIIGKVVAQSLCNTRQPFRAGSPRGSRRHHNICRKAAGFREIHCGIGTTYARHGS